MGKSLFRIGLGLILSPALLGMPIELATVGYVLTLASRQAKPLLLLNGLLGGAGLVMAVVTGDYEAYGAILLTLSVALLAGAVIYREQQRGY